MKKVIISMFALVLAIGLVACGSSEDKYAKEVAPVKKAYVDGSKAVIDQYKNVKTAADLKAADEAASKLDSDMNAKQAEILKKFEKVDLQKANAVSSLSNANVEFDKAQGDIAAAKQAAEDVVAKAKKDEKKK
ncbi:MAG TPA: hypothetical protein PLD82_08365 [Spirochaetota bacterium]|nr:hypothetical protein [Spirochaetota bacterium]